MTLNPFRIADAIRSHFDGPRDRGAALVEAAIAIPLLLVVIMGSIEFGFAVEARSAATSGVRTGIIRAATTADQATTDMQVLQSVLGEVGADNADRIEWVTIFDASVPDKEQMIADCDTNPGFGNCVVYRAAFLDSLANATDLVAFQAANFDGFQGHQNDGSYDCDGKEDDQWCAGKRATVDTDVEIGVAIKYNHDWFTGIFPFDPPTFEDHSVTSTFLHEGAAINPTAVNIPNSIGQVYSNTSTGLNGLAEGVTGITLGPGGHLDDNPPGTSDEFLGRFGTNSITLTVDTPQEHSRICVSFTLYTLGSWDAEDKFMLDINADGSREMDKSLARGDTLGDLGYNNGSWSDEGTKQTVEECADHTGSTADINFAGLTSAGVDNEAWAISNVVVTIEN